MWCKCSFQLTLTVNPQLAKLAVQPASLSATVAVTAPA